MNPADDWMNKAMDKDPGKPRFAEQRRALILQRLQRQGSMDVLELARVFDVSEHTIRRDLNRLDAAGVLRKTHGGAVVLDSARLGFDARAGLLAGAKDAIGRSAAGWVEVGQTVVLDAGSTTLAMARALSARPLTVITNALDVAMLFERDPSVRLVLTGGSWHAASRGLRGAAAVEMLARCRADWAVLGACALDLRAGVTVTDEDDAELKRAMVAAASRTLVLADHSKHGSVAPFAVAGWGRIDRLVTDRPWPELAALGVVLQIAAPPG